MGTTFNCRRRLIEWEEIWNFKLQRRGEEEGSGRGMCVKMEEEENEREITCFNLSYCVLMSIRYMYLSSRGAWHMREGSC
jgi:hypothetical protein